MHLDLGSGLHCAPVYSVKGFTESSVYDDAISLWKLDEQSGTRADSIGSNDLTDNNTVGYQNMGPSGTVTVHAEGSNEYLTRASWTHGANFAYVGWIKNPSPANYDTVIDHQLNSGFPANVSLCLYSNSAALRAVVSDNTGTSPVTIDSLVSLSDGGWHFFAVWFDDSDKKLRISVDDETPVASAAMTGNWKGTYTLYFGGASGTIDAWDGNLARFGYYTSIPSGAVRTSLYNNGKGKSYADLTTAEKVGLVSYWNLDEASGDRADSHGSNTLTDNNTVGSATNSYPANLPGRVANFVTANSEYLSRTNFTFGSGSYTYAIWAYSSSPSTYQSFGSVGTGGWAGITSELGGLITAGTLYNQIGYDGGSLSNYSTKAAPSNDAWHLIMTTYDADTNIIQVYVDDVAGTAFSPADNLYNNAASVLRIGSLQNLSASYWNGQLSNAAVWSRVLTAQERTDLYNSGNGAPLP